MEGNTLAGKVRVEAPIFIPVKDPRKLVIRLGLPGKYMSFRDVVGEK